jgi:hypothetical protein
VITDPGSPLNDIYLNTNILPSWPDFRCAATLDFEAFEVVTTSKPGAFPSALRNKRDDVQSDIKDASAALVRTVEEKRWIRKEWKAGETRATNEEHSLSLSLSLSQKPSIQVLIGCVVVVVAILCTTILTDETRSFFFFLSTCINIGQGALSKVR